MVDIRRLTETIKALALEAGFCGAGVAPAAGVRGERTFREWLEAGCHGEMHYLARGVAGRFRPETLLPGAAAVLCLAVGYAPDGLAEGRSDAPFIAPYARGRDYHKVLKKRALGLMDRIRRVAPGFEGRAFVDSAPLAERSLAAAAGLGWIGRNGCLIMPGRGSYVVLCEIVCNLPLTPDAPRVCSCGDCDACVRACPTGACRGDGLIDARRCLSYLSVEHRGRIDGRFWPLWGTVVFGCDRCQSACPHNRCAAPGDEELRRPPPARTHQPTLGRMLRWREDDWDAFTRGSAMRRAALRMVLRNAILAAGNSGDASLAGPLRELKRRRGEFAGMIDWALGRLRAATRRADSLEN